MKRGKGFSYSDEIHQSLLWLLAAMARARSLSLIISLITLSTLLSSGSAEAAAPSQGSDSHVNLFSLPLEDVLNIRVDGKAWDGKALARKAGNENAGSWIYVLNRRDVVKSLRDHRANTFLSSEMLLAIDGFDIGPVESRSDLENQSTAR